MTRLPPCIFEEFPPFLSCGSTKSFTIVRLMPVASPTIIRFGGPRLSESNIQMGGNYVILEIPSPIPILPEQVDVVRRVLKSQELGCYGVYMWFHRAIVPARDPSYFWYVYSTNQSYVERTIKNVEGQYRKPRRAFLRVDRDNSLVMYSDIRQRVVGSAQRGNREHFIPGMVMPVLPDAIPAPWGSDTWFSASEDYLYFATLARRPVAWQTSPYSGYMTSTA